MDKKRNSVESRTKLRNYNRLTYVTSGTRFSHLSRRCQEQGQRYETCQIRVRFLPCDFPGHHGCFWHNQRRFLRAFVDAHPHRRLPNWFPQVAKEASQARGRDAQGCASHAPLRQEVDGERLLLLAFHRDVHYEYRDI